MNTDILIIGAGASGLAAAISAKQAVPQSTVTVAEALDRCGRKLLVTGNGRCNIMNEQAQADHYQGGIAFVSEALAQYKRRYSVFWNELGVPLKTESEGRMYPCVNQASAVLDALRLRLEDLKITLKTDFQAECIEKEGNEFSVTNGTDRIQCRRLIIATGGRAGKGLGENDSFLRLLRPFGHTFAPQYPALTCLKTRKGLLNGLKGVRLKGDVKLYQEEMLLGSETGEVLFQDDGLSGIAVMQLSLIAAPLIASGKLFVRLSPLGNAKQFVEQRAEMCPDRQTGQLLAGAVNRMILLNALKRAGISPSQSAGTLTPVQIDTLAEALESWDIPIIAAGTFREAQVMLGGAKTEEFDMRTLESKKVRGLYAAGELMDVTGPCGGYNLEWAWASGLLAGRKAAESL